MRSSTLQAIALTLGLLAAASGRAHEGGTHSRGTVKEIAADRIVLVTGEGASVTVPMDAETRILRGRRTITAADVHPGERAVVHAAPRDGKIEATEVMVAEVPR